MANLKKRNEALFAERFPDALAVVRTVARDPALRLVGKGRKARVLAGGQELHPGGAQRHAREQVAAFLRKPLVIETLSEDWRFVREHLSADEIALYEDVEALLAQAPGDEPPEKPASHYLLVLGAGLGFTLTELLAKVKCRHLIVVEPFVDFLRLGMEVLDWSALMRDAERRGVTVHLFAGTGFDPILAAIWTLMRRDNPAAVGGLKVFRHLEHPALNQFIQALTGNRSFLAGWGFFDDEVALLSQTVANLRGRPHARLLDPDPAGISPAARRGTVVIVGSGPSLETRFDELRALSGRATIVSCGSSLRPLLKAGIRPYFHVEKERDPWRKEFIATENVTGIRQLVPTTVDPAYLDLLAPDDVLFYLRPDASPETLFDGQCRALRPCGAKVDHVAVSLMLALGAARVVFVGIDLGSRDAEAHHADGVLADATSLEALNDTLFQRQYRFDQRAPGNFGGEVATSDVLLSCKAEHEDVMTRFPTVRWFNASDGLRLNGAMALKRLDDALDDRGRLSDPEVRRIADLDEARLRGRLEAASASARAHRLAPLLAPDDDDPEVFARRLSDFFEGNELDPIHWRMVHGQAQQYLDAHRAFRTRAAALRRGRELDRLFLDRIAAILGAREAVLRDLLAGLADGLAGGLS